MEAPSKLNYTVNMPKQASGQPVPPLAKKYKSDSAFNGKQADVEFGIREPKCCGSSLGLLSSLGRVGSVTSCSCVILSVLTLQGASCLVRAAGIKSHSLHGWLTAAQLSLLAG